jgi:sugar phosphate isomerase/epimerase
MSGESAEGAATSGAALSTMWAVQPRFERDLPAFLTRAAELGYTAVEINHSMTPAQVQAITGSGRLTIGGVHGPAPLEEHPRHGWNRSMNLASRDDAERRAAVAAHLASIELAARTDAPHVVIHLGAVGDRMLSGERRLRELHEARALGGDQAAEQWDEAVERTRVERARLAPAHLEQARRSLRELADAAEQHEVALGLECRLGYHEIPQPDECAALLTEFESEHVGYLHDVGHAEIQHRLGLTPLQAWFDLLGERLIAVHLHDVRGLVDHRAPGNGDVDFDWLADRINGHAARVFEIDQHEADSDLASGLELLRTHGIVGGRPIGA